jgi:hypothetical protein
VQSIERQSTNFLVGRNECKRIIVLTSHKKNYRLKFLSVMIDTPQKTSCRFRPPAYTALFCLFCASINAGHTMCMCYMPEGVATSLWVDICRFLLIDSRRKPLQ